MSQISSADRWTYAFYGGGALAALVGQVWAAADHMPFPDTVPVWARAIIVAPAVAVIEVGGVAMAARGDLRRQLGETAMGYRLLSAAVALFAVGFNWFGHQSDPWLAAFFAGFSALAYAVWLLQSGDRRRDALRTSRKASETAPVYGLLQWAREYGVTRRARAIALETGVGLYESLRLAREEARKEARRKAISGAVAAIIRESQKDPKRAAIATTTYDMEALADRIEAQADYDGWAAIIGQSLLPDGAESHAAAEAEVSALRQRAAEAEERAETERGRAELLAAEATRLRRKLTDTEAETSARRSAPKAAVRKAAPTKKAVPYRPTPETRKLAEELLATDPPPLKKEVAAELDITPRRLHQVLTEATGEQQIVGQEPVDDLSTLTAADVTRLSERMAFDRAFARADAAQQGAETSA